MSDPKCNAKSKYGTRAVVQIAGLWLGMASIAIAQSAAPAAKSHSARKPEAHHALATPAEQEPAPPLQPEMPKWPANHAPEQPAVSWNSQGLRIQAANASLSQILNEVSTETGAKIEGLTGDERVFGEFGPGQPRDVLSQLLHGSGYDFLLLGTEPGPLKVILSERHTGAPGQAQGSNRPTPEGQPDEDQGVDVPDSDDAIQPQPPIQQPPPTVQENPQGEMTPQQRMQLMQQQRLQQMQQLQQQYQQNQQNQQNQQPPQ